MTDTLPCPLCKDPMDKKDISSDSLESEGTSPVVVKYLNVFRFTCQSCNQSWVKHGASFRPE